MLNRLVEQVAENGMDANIAQLCVDVFEYENALLFIDNVCEAATPSLSEMLGVSLDPPPAGMRLVAHSNLALYTTHEPDANEMPVLRLLTALRSMTERERAAHDNSEKLGAMKDNFLANMSHEIRTPLNGIIGMTRMLMESRGLTVEHRQHLSIVHDCGFQLLDLINDILDYSKMSVGGLGLDRSAFDLRECVESAHDVVALKARDKDLVTSFCIDPNVPLLVLGDGKRLRQVLVNLLSNAVKFTVTGSVTTRVRLMGRGDGTAHVRYTRRAPPAAESIIFDGSALSETHWCDHAESETPPVAAPQDHYIVQISVEDTGVGIPRDQHTLIFDAFAQVTDTVEKGYEHEGGTGLGLAISKQLVVLMKGTLTVWSDVGVGSIFTVQMPLEENALAIASTEIPDNYTRALNCKSALVVDDNAVNRLSCCHMLLGWGMKPYACASGDEALMYLNGGFPADIAFIDICMPNMGGVELAGRIKLSHPELPLVALSSIGDTFDATPDTFKQRMVKPVKSSHLLNVCIRLLSTETVIGGMSTRTRVVRDVCVLVVDDFVHNQTVACTQLAKLGCKDVQVAGNGLEAVEACRRKKFDLVLMDIKMPLCDGYTATAHIHEMFPNTADRPYIIAMTALVLPENRLRCQRAGMDGYLSKPLSLDELETMLDVIVERDAEDEKKDV
jgi:signal transduction histidine kinase/DNA-binding response OmpR family regulator